MEDKQKAAQEEGEEAKIDMEIVAEVLKEKSKSSTFLASMGASSSSRHKSTSHEHIRELEQRLETQELAARSAADRYQEEMNAILQSQRQELDDLKMKQEEQIAAMKREQAKNNASVLKKQDQLDAMMNYMLSKYNSNEPMPQHMSRP